MTKHNGLSVFQQLKAGLEDSIAYSKGELSLRTAELPSPPPSLTPADIRTLRHSLRMSQALFAATLNVSPKTVQSWEQGVRTPGDAALRMLQVVSVSPGVVRLFFAPYGRSAKAARAKTGGRRR